MHPSRLPATTQSSGVTDRAVTSALLLPSYLSTACADMMTVQGCLLRLGIHDAAGHPHTSNRVAVDGGSPLSCSHIVQQSGSSTNMPSAANCMMPPE